MTVNGIAPVVSPVLGGFIASHFDWRMLFWVMAGAGLALLIASQWFIPETLTDKQSGDRWREPPERYLKIVDSCATA